MAQETINVGSSANDGTGDALRSAFVKCNNNFTELYNDESASEVNSIAATAPIARDTATGTVTISLNDAGVTFAKMQNVAANSLLIRNANSSGVLSELALATTQIMIGDGTGMVAAALSGDVTMTNAGVVTIGSDKVTYDKMQDTSTANRLLGAVSAGTIGEVQVATAMVADDAISFAKLEARYTTKIDITTYTGAVSIDWATGTTFKMGSSLTGAIEFDFTNFKQGQVITIYNLTGSQTITLDSDAATSETFNKVGAVDYAGGSTNTLIVECIDDSANAIFNYTIAEYVADTTP